jgi:hypothetical protein
MPRAMAANDCKAFVRHTNPRDKAGIRCACTTVTALVDVLDARPVSPRESLSNDGRGTPDPPGTEALFTEQAVSHVAAQ